MKASGAFALGLGVFLLDQATKFWVLKALPTGETIRVLPVFSLTHVLNTGAAFGLFQGANTVLIVTTVLILLFLAYAHRSPAESLWTTVGLGLVWGGALGNLLDRVFRGNVVDFLDFHWRGWYWPAFNLADAAICTGVVCLILAGIRPARTTRHAERRNGAPSDDVPRPL